jgi:hypothetical protein
MKLTKHRLLVIEYSGGSTAAVGDRVVVDWEGYTIGTVARIIDAYVNSAHQVMLHIFQGTTVDRSRLETWLQSTP